MTTLNNTRKAAFRDLTGQADSSVSVWVSITLLPDMAQSFLLSDHSSLQQLGRACTEVYEGEDSFSNSDCSIKADTASTEDPGAILTFQSQIVGWTSQALTVSENKAAAKIGFELRSFHSQSGLEAFRQQGDRTEIRWRGRGFFINGINIPAQAATLTLNRSCLTHLARTISHPMYQQLFADLADLLDPENENVNEELDDEVGAVDEDLINLQKGIN